MSSASRWILRCAISPVLLVGCLAAEEPEPSGTWRATQLEFALEPPEHAVAEPHRFDECPDGACQRSEPGYLFSGEFFERVVDMRIPGRGLDFVWARKYRSKLPIDSAQGIGWDHSYNVFIESLGAHTLVVHDGNARPTVFTRDETGEFTAPRFRRTGRFEADGTFVITFADSGVWRFFPVAAGAPGGKLESITDRNGNRIRLGYDESGRLEQIVDTLERRIDVAYDGDGRIAAVTDFTGRSVAYRYYQSEDDGGSVGDLRSVTLPPISGTPNGNDFPYGITTTYTYSTGFGDDRLDHNLLTITDGRGNTVVRNVYSPSTNPETLEYDRLITQAWGNEGDLFGLTYGLAFGDEAVGAVQKTIVNDRIGRVSEHFFDQFNQRVGLRQFSGFADPRQPTAPDHNRPVRGSDEPMFYEHRFRYNVDGLMVEHVFPGGEVERYTYLGDVEPEAGPHEAGNLLEHSRLGGASPYACDADEQVTTYAYLPGFGNEHPGRAFVTTVVDPNGNETLFEYDDRGNRVASIGPEIGSIEDMVYNEHGQLIEHVFGEDQSGGRRTVQYEYYESGAQQGYLRVERQLGDCVHNGSSCASLETAFEYDDLGRTVRTTDPRGNDRLYQYNALDQVVREETRPLAGERVKIDSFYDANMNPIQVSYGNADCHGASRPGYVTDFGYDVLNAEVFTRTTHPDGTREAHHLVLDGERQPILQVYGPDGSSATALKTVETTYDARGLAVRVSRANSAPERSTTEVVYDANGRIVVERVGIEGPAQESAFEYDCLGRLIVTTDAMGNRAERRYDLNDNVVEERIFGELDDCPGTRDNRLLSRTEHRYDGQDRLVSTIRHWFDPATGRVIEDGEATEVFVYDGESRRIGHTDGNGNRRQWRFDGVGRLAQTTDPEGNVVRFSYDENGNVVQQHEVLVSQADGTTATMTWNFAYDQHDNRIRTVDPLGNASTSCHDALGNRLEHVDERGNRTLFAYDGNGRELSVRRILTTTGDGSGAAAGEIVTSQEWDGAGRRVSQTDPNGNTTRYHYDQLDRVVDVEFADGTLERRGYDVHDNEVLRVDANGTVISQEYDLSNRRTHVAITPGSGIDDSTTFERFRYDGLGNLVRAENDVAVVTRRYDSMSSLLEEVQNRSTVRYVRDRMGNPRATMYPSGRRIAQTFDRLHRTLALSDADGVIAGWQHSGHDRIHTRSYPSIKATSVYSYDAGRRLVEARHAVGAKIVDHRRYAWDAAGNRVRESSMTDGEDREARHDSLDRLIYSRVRNTKTMNRETRYQLDSAGNRLVATGGSGCDGTYVERDSGLNQYRATGCAVQEHDQVGNLRTLDSGNVVRELAYDAFGRLARAEIDDKHGRAVEIVFSYDALGRKIEEHTTTQSTCTRFKKFCQARISEARTLVYDDRWRVIEEQVCSSHSPYTLVHSYVWGDGSDALVQRADQGIGRRQVFFFEDVVGSIRLAVARGAYGLEFERYDYLDYGLPVDHGHALRLDNRYLFTGRRWHPVLGLYDYRTRHLDPRSGRFTSLDRLGIWGDEGNLGNGYTYVGNDPWSDVDPTGLAKEPYWNNVNETRRREVRSALFTAEWRARHVLNWVEFYLESRTRRDRKDRWNRDVGGVRTYFGSYNGTRFARILRFMRRQERRLRQNRIRIKATKTGGAGPGLGGCKSATTLAWTYPANWHAMIRLCIQQPEDDHAFFDDPALRVSVQPTPDGQAETMLHEVAHNIGPLDDHAYGFAIFRLSPRQQSYNADTYAQFAFSRLFTTSPPKTHVGPSGGKVGIARDGASETNVISVRRGL